MESSRRTPPVGQTLIALIIGWALLYNLLVKELGLLGAFFGIIDTITEDLFMAAGVSIAAGLGICLAYSLTQCYVQLLCRPSGFRIAENLFAEGDRPYRRMLSLYDEPEPETCYPVRSSSALASLAVFYLLNALCIAGLSEGVALLAHASGIVVGSDVQVAGLLPALALSLPLSLRLMAQFGYPHVRSLASALPLGAILLLLVQALRVAGAGGVPSFWSTVLADHGSQIVFLHSVLLLSFVPVFLEMLFWMFSIFSEQEEGRVG
jgi:hypothetical protein